MKGWKQIRAAVKASGKFRDVMSRLSGEAHCLDCDWQGKGSVADAAGRSVQHCVNLGHRVAVRVGNEHYMNVPYDPVLDVRGFDTDGEEEVANIDDIDDGTEPIDRNEHMKRLG